MRIISYSIEIDEVRTVEDEYTPILKYCGVYPSEAFKTPQELAQSIVDVLNEEFDLDMIIRTAMRITKVDTESYDFDAATIKARQERIAKNKRELGF